MSLRFVAELVMSSNCGDPESRFWGVEQPDINLFLKPNNLSHRHHLPHHTLVPLLAASQLCTVDTSPSRYVVFQQQRTSDSFRAASYSIGYLNTRHHGPEFCHIFVAIAIPTCCPYHLGPPGSFWLLCHLQELPNRASSSPSS